MEKYYLALLSNIEGINLNKVVKLLKYFNSAENLWHCSYLDFIEAGFDEELANKFFMVKSQLQPEQLAQKCQKLGLEIITYLDENYPIELKNIAKAPLVLFVKGFLGKKERIAIVGSRRASAYGLSVAKQFASDLSECGLEVVSGGAKGIDAAAHQGALQVQKATIAVFGCGLNVFYPHEHKKLFLQILENNGAWISEYLPDEPPKAWHFPARNRIISGLAKGVLVVEANKKSGSLITANFAVENNKEVYCVPGSIYSTGSIGVHNLIKQGAMLVDRPEDILNDMGRLFTQVKKANEVTEIKLNKNEQIILDYLIEGKSFSVEDITENTGLSTADVSLILLELEMSGWVVANAGLYQRLGRKMK